MKKRNYKLKYICLLFFCFFLYFSAGFTYVKAEETIHISLLENKENAAVVSMTYFNELEEEITIDNTTAIPYNTKVKFSISLEDGYDFVGMFYQPNDPSVSYSYYNILSTKTSFSVTLKKSYEFFLYYKTTTEHSILYYNINNADLRKVLGIEIVEEGASAKGITVPTKKGYQFTGFNHSIKHVTKDLEVYPEYDATIFSVLQAYWKDFLKGLGMTLLLSVISVFMSAFLGIGLCFMKISKKKVLSIIAGAYIEIVRGVPLLLQLLLIYSIFPRISFGFFTTEILACVIALFLNSCAYVAEIYRSGINAVDKGQMEAARALGLSYHKAMRKIILPQAIKNVLPSLGNELIAVIKETSLASSVDMSIGELMSIKKQITASSFINLPPFIIIATIYFIVTFTLSKLVGVLERRLQHND